MESLLTRLIRVAKKKIEIKKTQVKKVKSTPLVQPLTQTNMDSDKQKYTSCNHCGSTRLYVFDESNSPDGTTLYIYYSCGACGKHGMIDYKIEYSPYHDEPRYQCHNCRWYFFTEFQITHHTCKQRNVPYNSTGIIRS